MPSTQHPRTADARTGPAAGARAVGRRRVLRAALALGGALLLPVTAPGAARAATGGCG
ncbi:hypothetical protein ACFP1Z_15960 [Streptomyces gamaensis]|uniref:Uncharacterized protein n=1 Tax=Streptomyces gamaensis TaxID=1763542 RepID=A0ABW0Z0V5_9ACTN